MNPKLSLTLFLFMLPAIVFAAEPVAGPSIPPAIVSAISATARMQPVASAGAAENLPDVPKAQLPVLQWHAMPRADAPAVNRLSHFSLRRPNSPGVSPLASMPLAVTAQRLGAQHFNMDDGSMLYNFAICYRMSARSSIEVIPGDPAPVKLPIHTVANNTGVTVGLVVRLSK